MKSNFLIANGKREFFLLNKKRDKQWSFTNKLFQIELTTL